MQYYYYTNDPKIVWPIIIGALVGCIIGITICGFICKTINEKKGYKGGFAWGFLGVIGIIIVAVRQDNPNRYVNVPQRTMQDVNAMNQQIISNGGWKCFNCGSANYAHTGSCGCGMTKQDSISSWQQYFKNQSQNPQQYQQQYQQYPQQQQQYQQYPQQYSQYPQQQYQQPNNNGYPQNQYPNN